jgi:hypothetical protein
MISIQNKDCWRFVLEYIPVSEWRDIRTISKIHWDCIERISRDFVYYNPNKSWFITYSNLKSQCGDHNNQAVCNGCHKQFCGFCMIKCHSCDVYFCKNCVKICSLCPANRQFCSNCIKLCSCFKMVRDFTVANWWTQQTKHKVYTAMCPEHIVITKCCNKKICYYCSNEGMCCEEGSLNAPSEGIPDDGFLDYSVQEMIEDDINPGIFRAAPMYEAD